MKKVRIEELQPGMKLAKSIYANDGRMLVKEKTELSEGLLDRLRSLGLPAAYIEDDTELPTAELISEITRVDLIKSMAQLEQVLRSGHKLDLLYSKKPLFTLIDEVNTNQKNPLGTMPDIRLHGDYIYGHSVNVCVIAVKMGLELGLNQLKLAELAIGALFHDIGMTAVPLDILNKTGNLTQEEIKVIQKHPETGYQLLRENPEVSNVSAHIAYQHHERFDGSGYPRNLSGSNIHEFARIVSIADVFDSLTTEKVYRPAMSFGDAVKYVFTKAGTEFDPKMVKIFLQIIRN